MRQAVTTAGSTARAPPSTRRLPRADHSVRMPRGTSAARPFPEIPMQPPRPSRREFLELTTLALTAAGSSPLLARAAAGSRVSLVVSSADPIANAGPVQLAVSELRRVLTTRGVEVTRVGALADAPTGHLAIIVASSGAPGGGDAVERAGAKVPTVPESLAIVPYREDGRPVLLACGPDVRGLMYAVLELGDRVRYGDDPLGALEPRSVFRSRTEQPFNRGAGDRAAAGLRRRGPALVSRSGVLAGVLRPARPRAHQPLPPAVRHGLRHAAVGEGRRTCCSRIPSS